MEGYEIRDKDVHEIIRCMESVADTLRIAEKKVTAQQKDEESNISSIEIAQMFKFQHIKVFNMITKFITTEATEEEKREFRFAKRTYRRNRAHEICYLSERGCSLYLNKICSAEFRKSKQFSEGMEKMESEIKSRFRKEPAQSRSFLMDGRSRAECGKIKEIFDRFITGPGLEKREIAELTQRYKEFYEAMKSVQMKVNQSNAIEEAVYGVAIEAEMQGFIYGFKLYEELVNRQLIVA